VSARKPRNLNANKPFVPSVETLASSLSKLASACLSLCAPAAADGLEVEDTGSLLIVNGTLGAGFRVVFDKAAGTIVSFIAGSNILLDTAGPLPNLWRAPTDNDEGGGDNSFAAAWIKMGLQQSKMTDIRFSYMVDENAGTVVVFIAASLPVLVPAGFFAYTSTYTIKPNAEINMAFTWTAHPTGAAEFPPLSRIGVQFLSPKTFDRVSWYGRGPFESYPDRKDSAKVGFYSGTVADQYTLYVRPQEYGNKADTRWVSLHSAQNVGLTAHTIFPTNADGELPSFHTSVQEYAQDALTAAAHTSDLIPASRNTWNIDAATAGLGGDDSWSPRTHLEYQLREKEYSLNFTLSPFKPF